jgi:hypothetical protein
MESSRQLNRDYRFAGFSNIACLIHTPRTSSSLGASGVEKMTLTSGLDVVDDVAAWITDNIIGHLATLPLGGLKLTMPLALVRRAESRYD